MVKVASGMQLSDEFGCEHELRRTFTIPVGMQVVYIAMYCYDNSTVSERYIYIYMCVLPGISLVYAKQCGNTYSYQLKRLFKQLNGQAD